jgi:prepilin-type N-terminal cleavage/methylation domain-containing protein
VINNKVLKPKSAFSLIELSIVISIMAVLMTGAITISVSVINNTKKLSSIEKINNVYGAIGKFILANKRLPCPASLNINDADPMFGIERVNNSGGCTSTASNGVFNSSNIYYGAIPVKTLGLSLDMIRDDFGSKLSYIIDHRFAFPFQEVPNFAVSSFGTVENLTSMSVVEKFLSANRTITDKNILVIISHGLNKFGAYNYNSIAQNSASTDADEVTNTTVGASYVKDVANSQIFDDLVFFKTRNQIVDDFNLYYLVACKSNATFTNSIYYGQTIYLASCVNTEYKRLPEAYCDKYGRLIERVLCP